MLNLNFMYDITLSVKKEKKLMLQLYFSWILFHIIWHSDSERITIKRHVKNCTILELISPDLF